MILRAFRITETRFIDTAFLGEGARLYGGRWNSVGTRMVYCAESLSLATLELLANLRDLDMLQKNYSVIPVTFDEDLVGNLKTCPLPKGWDSRRPSVITQRMGDEWATSMDSPILKVPSVVTRDEFNFLLNPAHPAFKKIEFGAANRLRLDPRIGRRE